VYNQSIDRETYQTQLAHLREDQLLIEMELNEAKVEELDIESAVNFALFAIGDASRFWIEASLEQKQRFQQSLFPEGLAFDRNEFETARTCLAFSYLRQISSRDSRLASRTGIEPVSPREREAICRNSKETCGMDSREVVKGTLRESLLDP